ncbi:hypothetical protein EA472_02585 [Natrarchaeobius oligotrophus]|uniref:Uncharacterized protein n=1 Tax=Natrarchaeobius chitinivorans TaxID=1679083 RepID=A0A3N6PNZ9_NATCH|nr:hypothetical protein EA472_02585 [Natrarchaeobius chitinivorans]
MLNHARTAEPSSSTVPTLEAGDANDRMADAVVGADPSTVRIREQTRRERRDSRSSTAPVGHTGNLTIARNV